MPKSFSITTAELVDALESGKGFDGSSIEGFTRISESDMIAMPEPETFQILPWTPGGLKECRIFCNILNPDGSQYECDPRLVLKRVTTRAAQHGFTVSVGPEIEYFYFKSADSPQPLDHAGYFDLTPPDVGDLLRRETVATLERMGIGVEYDHHEVAPSQHEIDLRFTGALRMADWIVTTKLVVKEVAQRHGFYATFMPKPLFGQNGSGMHTHISLFAGPTNAFFDAASPNHLSELAKHFLAGLLRRAREFAIITNQWVNSYKRLVPDYEAPVYVSWGQRNRSALVRVPGYKPGKEVSTRLELRNPDAACNPYLAFAAIIAAGIEGIEEGVAPPPATETNVFSLSEEQRESLGIEALPCNLAEAIQVARSSEFLKNVLGEPLLEKLLRNKTALWNEYRCHITQFEYTKDLPVL